jgi:UDP-N-acetylglucosamine diphosphorylase/glucosamine-1-phosphate N-acetyltransferase
VSLVLFEDPCPHLAPMTDLRPAWDVRSGAMTLLERLAAIGHAPIAAVPRDDIASVAREASPALSRTPDELAHDDAIARDPGGVLLLNAACVLPDDRVWSLAAGEALVDASHRLIAARVEARDLPRVLGLAQSGTPLTPDAPHTLRVHASEGLSLLSRPWHVRTLRDRALTHDLALLARGPTLTHADLAQRGVTLIPGHPVRVDPSARLSPSCVLDAERGPIVIDAGAIVRPLAVVSGPAYIGPGSSVLDHAIIKANTAIGPSCKVAGEVGGTIFQGFANKAHDGHLGDSWVGAWANLGAGTTNSNLLNTYAEVTASAFHAGHMLAKRERTGETFLGAAIADHAKTAICTRLMTGAIVHTGVMWAASRAITGTVAPFAWVTGEGEKRFRLDKFLDIARTVMARRGIALGGAMSHRIEQLFHATDAPRG